MALTPKGCHVRYVALDGNGKAEVRIECGEQRTSRTVKAREVSFRGAHVAGAARVDFVLSPAAAVCRSDGRAVTCKLIGDTSSESLRGTRRRRRRR